MKRIIRMTNVCQTVLMTFIKTLQQIPAKDVFHLVFNVIPPAIAYNAIKVTVYMKRHVQLPVPAVYTQSTEHARTALETAVNVMDQVKIALYALIHTSCNLRITKQAVKALVVLVIGLKVTRYVRNAKNLV